MLTNIVKLGIERGRIELNQSLSHILNYTFFPIIALVVMYFLRGVVVQGGSLGSYALPGIISMNLLFTGFMGLATNLISEREEGTLMRARTIPFGIHTYLIGKVLCQVALTLITILVIMAASAALFGNFFLGGPRLLALTWVLPLGLTSTLPWGAAFGSLIRHPRNLSFISLGMMGLLSISGIFYPVSGQTPWSQLLSQASPVYWIGLGVRGALMPETAVVAEVGQSWRMLETALVLIIWSLLGTLAAISIMRRSSRKEGGRGLMRSAWIRRRRRRHRGRHRA